MKEKLKTWHFAFDNDHLVDLVLKGIKRATSYLYDENEPLSEIGYRDILIYENEKRICITRTVKISIVKFRDITEEMARLEGEGDLSLEYYRKVHYDYFKSIDSNFNEDSLIVFEEFEVERDLTKERMNIALKIIEGNKKIFGNINSIKEINAGFNNALFDVSNKYVIKVCQNEELESTFKKENDFYSENHFDFIPKLYLYDDTKQIVPYIYEVMEKVDGKSLYYYWYKMDEAERESTIKEICKMLDKMHCKHYEGYDWNKHLKSEANNYYENIKNKFSFKEQELIKSAINTFDKYLVDNSFCLIHNDLHFDNILVSKDRLYLIDFNDIMVAPFDYDFRILFMCKEMPEKWANIEMDPLQKPSDYRNIDTYLFKYYPKLKEVKYLRERQDIYRLVRDMRCLVNYDLQELKDSVKLYANKLIK